MTLISCNRSFNRLPQGENKYNLTTVAELKDKSYREKIEDFYASGSEGTFTGKAAVQIYHLSFAQPDTEKAILISAGRTEAALKYKELIYDLFKNGYSIYIHDHRGQGLSGRMTTDHEMGYVDNFQFYIDDMKLFYAKTLESKGYGKIYLLAHSMGGAIGMTYLEQNPTDFAAAAFISPMFGFKPLICSVAKFFDSDNPEYALGQMKYKNDELSFKGNPLTSSKVRYERMVAAFAKVPKAKVGGATYRWLQQSCHQFGYLFNNIDKINTPFILFSAEKEQIVSTSAHTSFIAAAQKVGKDCRAFEIENGQHELLIEKDAVRIKTINGALNFFSKY